ncbi:hypothetical protein BV22DRAFT_1200146 [Leucogyrophana mollusca]|uniref:Uncharacterized protein n=1 Tax=Leucogyrophana mollusca TaxID=85980 RepID=A0ACB8AX55_9AGAM|nr:hypothetical protein BV22DRAFT_1200146 [Leucogyrophana mollusca]
MSSNRTPSHALQSSVVPSPSPAQSEPPSDRIGREVCVGFEFGREWRLGWVVARGRVCTALALDNYVGLPNELRGLSCSLGTLPFHPHTLPLRPPSAVPALKSLRHRPASSTNHLSSLFPPPLVLHLPRARSLLYSTTLISLLTPHQLALLARQRYVNSIVAQERLECMHASHARVSPSLTRMVIGYAMSRVLDMEALEVPLGWVERVQSHFPHYPQFTSQPEDDLPDDSHETSPPRAGPLRPTIPISDDTEMGFLTLSWCILHVEWKDVATRVRQEVEGVFEG